MDYIWDNQRYFIYKNGTNYSMTPYASIVAAYNDKASQRTFSLSSGGSLSNPGLNADQEASPVINISPKYAKTLIGTGTMADPYRLP